MNDILLYVLILFIGKDMIVPMKKLFVYLKGYIKECILGPLFKLLEALFELFVPLVVASIIDRGIIAGDQSYAVKMCLLMVGLALVGLTCSITAQYFASDQPRKFGFPLLLPGFRNNIELQPHCIPQDRA